MKEYRVWYFDGGGVDYLGVLSPEAGADLINKISKRDLKDPRITANAFGLEVFEDGEWSEWYDENGEDIEALADRR